MILSLFLFAFIPILLGLLIYFCDKSTKKIWAKLWKFEIGIERESKKSRK